MTAASMESCRFAARRSPRGRFWSVVDVRTRLQRVRHPFHQSIHIKQGAQLANKVEPKSSKFWIQSSLESPKHRRMRRGRLPAPDLSESAINRAKYPPLSYTLPIHLHHPSTRNA